MASAAKPALMVNSCTGKMGRAVAEAAERAGLQVLPYTLCGAAEAVPGSSIEVAGQQVALVGPSERDALIEKLKAQHPNLIMVDYTIPGERRQVKRPCRAAFVSSDCMAGRQQGRQWHMAACTPTAWAQWPLLRHQQAGKCSHVRLPVGLWMTLRRILSRAARPPLCNSTIALVISKT
jgi:hypothetical protein